ncbi:MAG: D-alanyl-lipoteichoic acid biosynthesis protein DltD [Coriobacteriaceae bacterium]
MGYPTRKRCRAGSSCGSIRTQRRARRVGRPGVRARSSTRAGGLLSSGQPACPGTYDGRADGGRAGCADLRQAIEIGAVSVADARAAWCFPSIQWFRRTAAPRVIFRRVSGAFEAFMANGDISDGLKRRAAQRAAEYGAGEPANEDPSSIVRDVHEAR